MKTKFAILIFFAAVTLALAQSPGRLGPEIVVDDASSAIFPADWLNPKTNPKAELVDEKEKQPCKEILNKALAKYPAAVLSANLKKVYVLGRLEYSGVTTGGTNSRNAVYVVKNDKYSWVRFEGNFHAEFSSILFRNFPQHLDQAGWQKINPPDFSYRGTGVQAIKDQQASLHLKDSLHEEGFLHEYGKASIEEDFNSYAGRLFHGDAGLWRAIEQFPKVKAKADLAMAFYAKLDASFTRELFLSFRQPEKN